MLATNVNERVLQQSVFSLSSPPQTRKARTTHLCQVRPHIAQQVDIHQVRLRPERPQARRLQRSPPVRKVPKVLAASARVDLELELADGEHGALGIRVEERRERVEFAALDVNLEDVNERVP